MVTGGMRKSYKSENQTYLSRELTEISRQVAKSQHKKIRTQPSYGYEPDGIKQSFSF